MTAPSTLAGWVARNAEALRNATPVAFHMLYPDTMVAVGAHVTREYDMTGYLIQVVYGDGSGALFEVSHSDGSRFRLWADRWGNVERVPDAAE
jgi:hypothetical protein